MAKTISKERGAASVTRARRDAEAGAASATTDTPSEDATFDAVEDADATERDDERALAVVEPEDEAFDEADEDGEAERGGAARALVEYDDDDDERLIAPRRARAVSRTFHLPEPILAIPGLRFIVESLNELINEVTWPTPNEAWSMTLVVIGVSAVVAAVLGLADLGLVRALSWVLTLGTK